ncbi:MAG TPA: transcriptional regulator [Nostocaceae cyanobacterium]|nr:transcriptional regulator [Nostocaceae cyanobacterium]
MAKSLPYQDFLISHLQDPSYAAGYLESHLELEEGEEIDPRLIKLALSNVAEALSAEKMTAEQAKLHQEKLVQILSQPLDQAIYSLADWLNVLGLKLTVTVAASAENSTFDSANNLEIPV